MRDDFGRDALAPIARLGIMGLPDARGAAEAIGDAMQEAIAASFTTATSSDLRKAEQAKVMTAIGTFRDLAERDFKR